LKIAETLDPKSRIAYSVALPMVICILGIHRSLRWYHSFSIISIFPLFQNMISYVWTKTRLMNINVRIMSKFCKIIISSCKLVLSRSSGGLLIVSLSILISSTCLESFFFNSSLLSLSGHVSMEVAFGRTWPSVEILIWESLIV
jgi:hypothetical protein